MVKVTGAYILGQISIIVVVSIFENAVKLSALGHNLAYKNYVTNKYHSANLVLIGNKVHVSTSGWQKTVVYLYCQPKLHMFYNEINQPYFIKKLI